MNEDRERQEQQQREREIERTRYARVTAGVVARAVPPVPSLAGHLDAREIGTRVRWVLCNAAGYPIVKLTAEPMEWPYPVPGQTMLAEIAKAPNNAALAFLEAAGLFIAQCCDSEPLCKQCRELADSQDDERHEP